MKMAGNIFKWWKHKFLSGYKQFSVLQDCTTDSEDVIYPINASSTYYTPPDLLLLGDRETIQFKNARSIVSTSKIQEKKRNRGTRLRKKGISPFRKITRMEKIPFEGFSYDVSVEGGMSSQCLQFSFTFYDLDGHHSKITKDDIAGIVYTIYESIGKSVVVPYCGSKTINVRLTVQPENKKKRSKKVNKVHSTASGTKFQKKKEQHESNKTFQEINGGIVGINKTGNVQNLPTNKIQNMTDNSNPKYTCLENKHEKWLSNEDIQQYSVSNKTESINFKSSIQNVLKTANKKQNSSVKHVNILRKSRKHKHQNHCYDSRKRSMSLGNENKWTVRCNKTAVVDVDKQVLPTTAEYWNDTLKRNDLLNIIRASMERNRLCFQPNGKLMQSEDSSYRQRSYTLSKTSEERDHFMSHMARASLNVSNQQDQYPSSSKNLCGYDSFLHATICTTTDPRQISNKSNIWKTSKHLMNDTDAIQSNKARSNLKNSNCCNHQTTNFSNINQNGSYIQESYSIENWHHDNVQEEDNDELQFTKVNKNQDDKFYFTTNKKQSHENKSNSKNIITNNKSVPQCRCYNKLQKTMSSDELITDSGNEEKLKKDVTFIPIKMNNIEIENLKSEEESDRGQQNKNSDNNITSSHDENTPLSNIHHYHEHIHHHFHHFKNENC